MSKFLKEDFLSVKAFSIALSIHTNTVYKAIKKGHIQAFRVGAGRKSSFRIPRSEIERMSKFNLEEVLKRLT